jgi:hypothetical protein
MSYNLAVMPAALTPGKLLPFEMGATSKGWHAIESFASYCPKEHQFDKVRKIRPRNDELERPLAIGLLLHAARAQWFNDGYKGALWLVAIKRYVKAWNKDNPRRPMPNDALPIAERTFTTYVKYWKLLPKPEVLAVEYELKPKVLVKDAPEWTARGARLDSIERYRGGTWIGELKSTSESVNSVSEMYALHGQVLLQLARWGEEETKRFGPLKGVLLDVVKKGYSDGGKAYPRAAIPLETLKHALQWFKKDFTTWVMQSSLIDWNTSPERRMNCMRPYGPCKYREICSRGRDGAMGFEFEDGTPLLEWKPSAGKEVPPWA